MQFTGIREQGKFELEAESADSRAVGIDVSKAPGNGDRHRDRPWIGTARPRGRTLRTGGRSGPHETGANQFDELLQEGAQVPTAIFELVQDSDAGSNVGVGHRGNETVDRVGRCKAEQVPDRFFVESVTARREELVQHRFGVAHASSGEAGNQLDRRGFGSAPITLENPGQLAFDLRGREAPNVESLKPRQDGRGKFLRVRRSEHEDDEIGRFLEGFQERVPGVLRDLVRLIQDVDLALQVRRGVVDPLAEFADCVDAAIRCGVDLDEVEGTTFPDRHARRAGVARVPVLEVRAVDGLGEDPGERCLARPARPDEQDRVRDPSGPNGILEGLDDGLLADDLGERLRPPAPIDRQVRRSGDGHCGCRWARGALGHAAPRGRVACSISMPCTPCRPSRARAHHRRRLGPGRSAAPGEDR